MYCKIGGLWPCGNDKQVDVAYTDSGIFVLIWIFVLQRFYIKYLFAYFYICLSFARYGRGFLWKSNVCVNLPGQQWLHCHPRPSCYHQTSSPATGFLFLWVPVSLISPPSYAASLLSLCELSWPCAVFLSSVDYEGLIKNLSVCQIFQMWLLYW